MRAMALLTLRNIQLGFGGPLLLDHVNLSIDAGERVCVLGRNGEGKSTLLKVIAGELAPDDGERVLTPGTRVARLTQEVPEGTSGSVFAVVADGLGEIAAKVKAYHAASQRVIEDHSQQALDRLAHAQQALEAADGWQLEQQAERVISRMQLDPEVRFEALSGGMKRRVLLARALASEPRILLLDEPTNHLDMASISWLEEFLRGWNGTLVFITHDRRFLRSLATRIVELDRGQASDWPGDYDNYLRRRAERDNAEALESARFDKKLAQEEAWIRQGIKARRTRNEGRVRQLKAMREEFGQRRSKQGTAKLAVNAAERSGKLVCEATNISYAWGDKPIVKDLTTTILRGDRIGIIGPNGCGKTTLLNLLLGRLQPDSGTVELGSKLEIAYFDQLRAQLNEDATVIDNVAEGSDKVEINGQSKHIIGYLQDFLFAPARARQPVRALSGGERNRLLLAKLFTKPANVLVMDEPTNDLDVETLELLEELLMGFQGTLLLVSHDRDFLDNVVTSTLVAEGDGRWGEYVGGYQDWLRQRPAAPTAKAESVAKATTKPASASAPVEKPKPKKLSYKDQRELDTLPQRIEVLENAVAELQQALADPELYKSGAERMAQLNSDLADREAELSEAYERWEALEELRAG
jgi:ATP-binding cassette subfamily F protein uup